MGSLRFKKESSKDFYSVLQNKVTEYFDLYQISKKADLTTIFKSVLLTVCVGLVYLAIINNLTSGFFYVFLWGLFGFLSGIWGLNIVHDALHGSYTSKALGNKVLGFVMDVCGISSILWKKNHIVHHHTFTNIVGHDPDATIPNVMRLSPVVPYRKIFRFQHIYAPMLYCLNVLHWAYVEDLSDIFHIFQKKSKEMSISKMDLFWTLEFKLIHFSIYLVIPLALTVNPTYQTIIGYIVYWLVMSFSLTTIFALPHNVESIVHPAEPKTKQLQETFAEHQMKTCANFGTSSKLTTFLCAGLNCQIEHHLFPTLPYASLPKIAPIVKQTALEFGLPYNEYNSYFSAFKSHLKVLKKLGNCT